MRLRWLCAAVEVGSRPFETACRLVERCEPPASRASGPQIGTWSLKDPESQGGTRKPRSDRDLRVPANSTRLSRRGAGGMGGLTVPRAPLGPPRPPAGPTGRSHDGGSATHLALNVSRNFGRRGSTAGLLVTLTHLRWDPCSAKLPSSVGRPKLRSVSEPTDLVQVLRQSPRGARIVHTVSPITVSVSELQDGALFEGTRSSS